MRRRALQIYPDSHSKTQVMLGMKGHEFLDRFDGRRPDSMSKAEVTRQALAIMSVIHEAGGKDLCRRAAEIARDNASLSQLVDDLSSTDSNAPERKPDRSDDLEDREDVFSRDLAAVPRARDGRSTQGAEMDMEGNKETGESDPERQDSGASSEDQDGNGGLVSRSIQSITG